MWNLQQALLPLKKQDVLAVSLKAGQVLLVLMLTFLSGCGPANSKPGKDKSTYPGSQAKARLLHSLEENSLARYHKVVAGESVYRIARVYGVEAEGIITINYLGDGGLITPGQMLLIPGKETGPEAYVLEVVAKDRRR